MPGEETDPLAPADAVISYLAATVTFAVVINAGQVPDDSMV